jgi:4-hydroxybenzoate polyprenyltransferase
MTREAPRARGITSLPALVIRELRIHQWVKNLLVFVPAIAGHVVTDPHVLLKVVPMFLAFCACASGVYVINDLLDLKTDRAHPRKRSRPFASGQLPLGFGALAPVLLLVGMTLAFWVEPTALLVLVAYASLSIAYSAYLKTQPLVDVFSLSTLYSLRVAGGGIAAGVESSAWLLLFSGFMFLSLAFLKRASEYQAIVASGQHYDTRRGYEADDVAMLKTMGVSASFVSAMVLGLYFSSDIAASLYSDTLLLWCSIPILLFWQARMWLSASRGYMTDDPIIYAARDWVSRLCLLSLLAVYAAARFFSPGGPS